MKNKKIALIALVIIALCALSVLVSACKPDVPDTPDEPQYFTVRFEGEGVSTAPQRVKKGETATEPQDPLREGYVFEYWFQTEGTPFDFSTAITFDTTLTAKWKVEQAKIDPSVIPGSGTQDDPYLIQCEAHLELLANAVKNGEGNFANAHYQLTADLDLTNRKVKIGTQENPFKGTFDGDNHTISNLTQSLTVRNATETQTVALFAWTETALFSNLSLANVNYFAETLVVDKTVVIGGLAGFAELTQFSNVSVEGTIQTNFLEGTTAYVGGLVGYAYNGVSAQGQGFIAFCENCYANVEMSVAENDDGSKGSLSDAAVGGLFGVVSNDGSTLAVINCFTSGNVFGGMHVGGLIGYATDLLTIINCGSNAQVEASDEKVCYVGGLLGHATGDCLVVDSIFTGSVKAKNSTSAGYNSYVGGIVGYVPLDSYDYYFVAGAAVQNCYYSCKPEGGDVDRKMGTPVANASYFTKERLLSKFGWSGECWVFDGETAVRPSATTQSQAVPNPVLTLQSNGEAVETKQFLSNSLDYGIVGVLNELDASANNLFWDWQLGTTDYRFYMPVVKNTTLTAKWQDVSEIVGEYQGKGNNSQSKQFVIVLNADGTMQWIEDSVTGGEFLYDGEHILFNVYNSVGEVSGYLQDGTMTFIVEYGMTDVSYVLEKFDAEILGEYVSAKGDILTFSAPGRMSFESDNYKDGEYVSGSYELVGNRISFSFSNWAEFSTTAATLESDGSITLDFQGENGSITDNFVALSSVDYSGKGFLQEFTTMWWDSQTNENEYRVEFLSDGTAIFRSRYTEEYGRYYYFQATDTIKMVLTGHVSTFRYNQEKDVLFGVLNRGPKRLVVGVPRAWGEVVQYATCERINYPTYELRDGVDCVLAFVCGQNVFVVKDDEIVDVTVLGEFAQGNTVTIDGTKYVIGGYKLQKVGAEAGTYRLNGTTFVLGGIGFGTCAEGGAVTDVQYTVFNESNLVVILNAQKFTLTVFDYQNAQSNNGTITALSGDGYQGVWLSYETKTVNGETQIVRAHDILVLDGFGHATVFYLNDENIYKNKWGTYVWGSYTPNAAGITASFNKYWTNIPFQFYYDNQFVYTNRYSSGTGSQVIMRFYSNGYNGTMEPPVFPAEFSGSFSAEVDGATQIINVREDKTGSYCGNVISNVVYVGNGTLYFTANGKQYSLIFAEDGQTAVLRNGENDQGVTFVRVGAVSEKIPAEICGTWSGHFYGYGTSETDSDRVVTISSDGTVTYQGNLLQDVVFDGQTLTITATSFDGGGSWTWTMVYDGENKTIAVTTQSEESITLTATLSKQA